LTARAGVADRIGFRRRHRARESWRPARRGADGPAVAPYRRQDFTVAPARLTPARILSIGDRAGLADAALRHGENRSHGRDLENDPQLRTSCPRDDEERRAIPRSMPGAYTEYRKIVLRGWTGLGR
jgi:hypothetical protein